MASIWDTPYTRQGQSAGYQTGFGGGTGTNPFFNSGSTYGADRDWNSSPIGESIREQRPDLAFSQWLGNQGVVDNDNTFNRWAMAQLPRFERGYGLATLQNPFLTIDQFIQTLPGLGALQGQFQQLSQRQRGEEWSTYAPGVRHISRM